MDPVTNDASGPAAEQTDTRPWRKRHPVLSRVLLFGVGAVLIVLLVVPYLERMMDDARTKLEGKLTAMEVGLFLGGGPRAVLEQVESDFLEPGDVPSDLKARALRFAALAKKRLGAKGGFESEVVQAAFAEARSATDDPEARRGLALESAEAHLEVGAFDAAREALASDVLDGAGPVWSLFREVFLAKTEADADPAAAAARLDEALSAALETGETGARADPVFVGARTWTLAQVAVHATDKRIVLARGESEEVVRSFWSRLAPLAASDGGSAVLCAAGLVATGDEPMALEVIQAARRVDPEGVETNLAGQPALKALLQGIR